MSGSKGSHLQQAIELLKKGEVVAYPTETCYGLGVRADDPEALDRLRRIKGRAGEQPISILILDPEWLGGVAEPLTVAEELLVKRYWPGPLTLLLRAKKPSKVAHLAAPLLGVRCSSHPSARALLELLGMPITSTSANPSGNGNPPDEAGARRFVEPLGVFILPDVIKGRRPVESTVVAIEGWEVRCLREGAISTKELAAFLDEQRALHDK